RFLARFRGTRVRRVRLFAPFGCAERDCGVVRGRSRYPGDDGRVGDVGADIPARPAPDEGVVCCLAGRTHALMGAAGNREQKQEDGRMAHVSECSRAIGRRVRTPGFRWFAAGDDARPLKIRAVVPKSVAGGCGGLSMRTTLFLCAATLIALATARCGSINATLLPPGTDGGTGGGGQPDAGGGGGGQPDAGGGGGGGQPDAGGGGGGGEHDARGGGGGGQPDAGGNGGGAGGQPDAGGGGGVVQGERARLGPDPVGRP